MAGDCLLVRLLLLLQALQVLLNPHNLVSTETFILKVTDRCDQCGAQAYVRVLLSGGGGPLFCSHHWNTHRDALQPQALKIHDETSRLTV